MVISEVPIPLHLDGHVLPGADQLHRALRLAKKEGRERYLRVNHEDALLEQSFLPSSFQNPETLGPSRPRLQTILDPA